MQKFLKKCLAFLIYCAIHHLKNVINWLRTRRKLEITISESIIDGYSANKTKEKTEYIISYSVRTHIHVCVCTHTHESRMNFLFKQIRDEIQWYKSIFETLGLISPVLNKSKNKQNVSACKWM